MLKYSIIQASPLSSSILIHSSLYQVTRARIPAGSRFFRRCIGTLIPCEVKMRGMMKNKVLHCCATHKKYDIKAQTKHIHLFTKKIETSADDSKPKFSVSVMAPQNIGGTSLWIYQLTDVLKSYMILYRVVKGFEQPVRGLRI